MSRRAATLIALAVSLVVLAGVPAAWALTREPAQVGSRFDAASPAAPAAPASPAPASPRPAPSSSAPAPPKAPDPVRVAVPSLGLSMAVQPVGVAADGQVEILQDARVAGWYRFGPAPGAATGSAVLVGHRDSRTQGRGGFYPLGSVRPGADVTVQRADGSTVTYRVVERRRYAKAVLPAADLFARDGAPRLTLITCGGAYRADQGGYQDNVVVTAVRVPGGGGRG